MKRYIPKEVNLSYVTKLAILAASYFLTAKIGLGLYAINGFATLIWAPSGIALALLILWGYDLWPGITIAAFAINLLTGAPFFVALLIGIGNTLEAVIGSYILRKTINLYRCFERVYDTIGFILVAALAAPLIAATVGSLALLLGSLLTPSNFFVTWGAWWIGDAIGMLVVTPFLLTWVKPSRPWNPDRLSNLEMFGFFSTLAILNFIIFWYPFAIVRNVPLLYLTLLPLIWGVLRLGSRGMTISLFITAIIATASTVLGHGPFIMVPVSQGLLFCQIFMASISITFLVFLSTVKERKRAMEEIREYVDKLRQSFREVKSSDQAKTDFLAMLAHELRNPLASILSSLELVSVRTQNGEVANIVDTTQTHVRHMSRLLDDLLDISLISKEKLAMQKDTVDMRSIINFALEEAMPVVKSKNHFVSVSMPGMPLYVFGDAVRLRQIIVNLLNNATKYTDPGGSISVQLLRAEDQAVVRVKDSGIGIAPEAVSKIFEPFLQVHNNAVKFGRGLGIGLSLSKKLVEAHEGTIAATSAGLGKGTEFEVRLPLVPVSDVLSIEKPSGEIVLEKVLPIENRTDRKQRYRILVVDDNQTAADGLSKLLQHKGHETVTAYSGESALQVISEANPQVILLDIGLPDMTGYQVAEVIRQKHNPVITLVALTGYGQYEDKLKSKEAGFNYHLTKPVSIIDIEAVLEEMVMRK